MALKVGMALYSVRGQMRIDPIRTIKHVGELGYKYVEAANYNLDIDAFLGFGVSPQDFKAQMDECGIKLINCHVGKFKFWYDENNELMFDMPKVEHLSDDMLRRCSEQHLIAGNDMICYPIMFYPADRDGVLRKCEYLNHLCQVARGCGTQMVYHSHFQEYAFVEDKMILEYLYENTDLLLELDTFWAMRGGQDPIEMLKEFGDKIIFIHQKDFSKKTKIPANIWHTFGKEWGDDRNPPMTRKIVTEREFFVADPPEIFTEIGTGIMPIQEIIHAVNRYTKAEYIILEQDFSTLGDEFKSAKISMENFQKYSGLEWA
jgi:sugar phosphate isomerase/epimerase